MANNKPRKRYIVDSQMQYKVLAIIVIYIFFSVLLTGLLMFVPSIIGLTGQEGQEQYDAAREILVLHRRFWPSIFIVVIILGIHSIFIFHRLFGPLYRFKSTMKQVSEGDLSFNFTIREKDFLKEEESLMNEMIDTLREKIGSLKKDNALLSQSINELVDELDSQDVSSESINNRRAEISQQEEKIVQGFDFFKIDKS